MSSNSTRSWIVEIAAVYRKEAVSELRQKSGVFTVALFVIVSVAAVAFASLGQKLSPGTASGLLWVTLLFSSVVAIPRIFLLEEEQGTGDLLRLSARAHSVFWGKSLFALTQVVFGGAMISMMFFGLTGISIGAAGLYAIGLLGGCAALAGATSLCGALVAQASNRTVLAGAISLPLLLPLVVVGVAATSAAIQPEGARAGTEATLGLWGYAAATWALGPHLFAAVWKR